MESFSEALLLIFIKNAQLGKVKTRLAASVGDKKALEVYQKLLAKTHQATSSLSCDRQIWYSNFIEEEDQWASGDYKKCLQQGDDLGDRMKNAFRRAFEEGYQRVVIIGSDCPEINPHILRQAFTRLSEQDVVIGPSRDGGYYLLGMSSFYGALFGGIEWSTPAVFEQTKARIKELGLSWETLPMLNDIDTVEDLNQSDFIPNRS